MGSGTKKVMNIIGKHLQVATGNRRAKDYFKYIEKILTTTAMNSIKYSIFYKQIVF